MKKKLTKKVTKKIKTNKWKKVGVMSVDSGSCLVGDPCYFVGKKETWHDFHDTLDEGGYFEKHSVQLKHELGHDGRGVVVSSGFGDGNYEVFIKTEKIEGWGERVKELKVVFIPDEEEEN